VKIFKFIIFLLLIPVALAAVYTSLEIVLVFGANTKMYTIPFWAGIATYVLFQIFFARPMRTYVFGHELTHALAGILSGATLKKFKVTKNGGSVTLDRNNIWITLSPYFIPFYSIIIIVCYLLLGFFINLTPFYPYFIFLVGITTAFHFALTYYAIKAGQKDLKIYGVFFSLLIIVLVNAITLTFVLAAIFPGSVNILMLFYGTFLRAVSIFQYILEGVKVIWASFQRMN